MANERTAEGQEGLVDVGTPFVAHAQTAKAVEPGERAFNDPAVAAQVLAAVLPTAGNAGHDAACPQGSPATSVVVAFVGVELFWSMRRGRPLGPAMGGTASMASSSTLESCTLAAESTAAKGKPPRSTTRWRFVPGRPRSTGFAPVFSPPFAPGSSRSPARHGSSRGGRHRPVAGAAPSAKPPTRPAPCQSRSRRQHVMPEPHPISGGSSSHGVPVRSTKTMPVSTARSGMRGLPPRGRGGAGRQDRFNLFPEFIAHQRLGHRWPNLPENPVLLDALKRRAHGVSC